MSDTHPSRARNAGKPTKSIPATTHKEMSEMRDNPVPCVNATFYEVSNGKHMTWEESGMCPRCTTILDMFTQRRVDNEAVAEMEPVI